MPDCKACKDNKVADVPYIVHESAMARQERTIKRLVIMLIVILAIWFSTIGVFVWYLNQYDFENYDVEFSTEKFKIDLQGRAGEIRLFLFCKNFL